MLCCLFDLIGYDMSYLLLFEEIKRMKKKRKKSRAFGIYICMEWRYDTRIELMEWECIRKTE